MTILNTSPAALPATLIYSHHAIERALTRKLPILQSLPPVARLADRDTQAMVYKVDDTKKGFYVILSEDNVVLTTFRKKDETEWQRWRQAREKRRGREVRGLRETGLMSGDDDFQDTLDAEYAACRLVQSAFSGGWQERFETRRARRFLQPHPRALRDAEIRQRRHGAKEGFMRDRPIL